MDHAPLTAEEARVLGSLIEKQITTPDNYPLSLNALVNACNQLTNREPVVSYDEPTVVRALDQLRDKRLITLFHGADSRVSKYRHNFAEVHQLMPPDVALLCVLLLRGPQTVGELRTRTERLRPFADLAEVEDALQSLATREAGPLALKLPRQPGTKESRWAHLLAGPPALESMVIVSTPTHSVPPAPPPVRAEDERMAQLESEVATLRQELADLRQQVADFRKQFE